MDPLLKAEANMALKQVKTISGRFSGMRIIITGAAGFLGAHFVHFFLSLNDQLEDKCTILAYDNFMRGKPEWLEKVAGRKDMHIKNRNVIEEIEFEPCDYIIHAASIASPVFYRKFPIETMDVNVKALRNILEFAKTHPLKGILQLSSSEVYGNPPAEEVPTSETYWGLVSTTGPRACYDESKRYAETLCIYFQKQYSIPVKIARPFNVYGTGLNPDDGRVLSDFFRDLITTGTVNLLSDGSATRTFCYISDAMSGFIRTLLLGKDGEVYNIGNDNPEISISELADKLIELNGGTARKVYCTSEDPAYLIDNPLRRCPNLTKARRDIGYAPAVSLEEGLRRSLEYYKSIL